MTSIQEIADEIYNNVRPKSPQDFINSFEKYNNIINTLDYNLTSIDYNTYSQLISDYGIAIAETKSYKKAIPIIEKGLLLLRNNSSFSSETLPTLKFYETLIFKLGTSFFYVKDYSSAKSNFQLLTKLYPDNSIYQNWMIAIKNKTLNRIKNILWYCVTGSTLLSVIFNKTPLDNIFLGIGVFCLISVLSLELVLYFRRKNTSV